MEQTIKIARYRNFPYIVNYPVNGGGLKTFKWAGSKGNKVDVVDLPTEVIDWLLMSSSCFSDGELVIVEDSDKAKEVISIIDEEDSYNNNTHTREEIIKILEGNINKMKTELNKITVQAEKQYVLEVAKEIKLDVASKQKFIAEWIGGEGAAVDVFFDE